jgi:hypothetical protein
MTLEILRHTPTWVWLVLALCLQRGYAMTVPQQVSPRRANALPFAFMLLSLAGVVSSFGARPDALLCWAAGLGLAAYETLRHGVPAGAAYDPASGQLRLPGSWAPLLLVVLIFAVKYTVGVELALHPALRQNQSFALAASTAYGVLSGVFLGRALRLRPLLLQLAYAPADGPPRIRF